MRARCNMSRAKRAKNWYGSSMIGRGGLVVLQDPTGAIDGGATFMNRHEEEADRPARLERRFKKLGSVRGRGASGAEGS